MEKEIEIWNNVLGKVMQMPGVKVNREYFLRKNLSIYCNEPQVDLALEKGTIGNVSLDVLDKIALECINNHTIKASGISFVMGIPGSFAMLGTIPGDVLQYYFHVFVLAQKLAYIYGYPNLCDEDGRFTESSANLLTIFVGVMGGVAAANKAIKEVAFRAQKEVMKRLPRYALTKGVVYPLVKQVAKWIGISLTKNSFAKAVGKFVPVLGGFISGGLTYAFFRPQAKKLMINLKETMLLALNNKNEEFTKEDIQEV